MIGIKVARIIANYALFLERADEEILDPDAAAQMLEVLSSDIQALDKDFLRELVDAFAVIAPEYSGENEKLVRNIPYYAYLEETLAADDPVRLNQLEAQREARED